MTKVLVIEDEELIRESILNLLNTRGFSAIGSGYGKLGLQLAKEIVPDLILCDVRMPEFDGYEVLKALRQDPITATIPFIFLTAETNQDIQRPGQLNSENAYLTKPFTTAELLEAIATYIS